MAEKALAWEIVGRTVKVYLDVPPEKASWSAVQSDPSVRDLQGHGEDLGRRGRGGGTVGKQSIRHRARRNGLSVGKFTVKSFPSQIAYFLVYAGLGNDKGLKAILAQSPSPSPYVCALCTPKIHVPRQIHACW